MRNLLLILLLSTVTGWATAAPQGTAKAAPDQLLERLIGTSDIGDALPLTTAGGLVAFSADSKLYIMSANGRFLIDGRVRDLWHNGRTLNSMADIERYALRLDLDALGLDFDQLVTVRVGHGAKKATLLVAPGCPACVRAIDAVRALGDTYTTRIVVVPRVNQVGLVQRI
ncbi:MAG: hypothetical protein L0H29_08485, partial [Sinobacteraceae bacterium]|nr:hypothetical protein [Nevskiaceae bacterium]